MKTLLFWDLSKYNWIKLTMKSNIVQIAELITFYCNCCDAIEESTTFFAKDHFFFPN